MSQTTHTRLQIQFLKTAKNKLWGQEQKKGSSLANKKAVKGNSMHTKIVNLATYTRTESVCRKYPHLILNFLQTQLHHFQKNILLVNVRIIKESYSKPVNFICL